MSNTKLDPTAFGPDWDDRMAAVDLVQPLVDEAVRLLRESEHVKASVVDRKVDPRKSPLVAQAYQRLVGACELLSAMWRQLGMSEHEMDADKARRIVQFRDRQLRLLAAVRQHAQDYYAYGWDVVVEAFTDEEILTELDRANARTEQQAIERFAQIVELADERRVDRTPLAGWDY